MKASPPAPNFFALLWQVEHDNPARPQLGHSLRLRDDPVRLGQHPHLDFATQDFQRQGLIQTKVAGAVAKLYVQNFGLLGPNGALPLHYTEYAYTRVHQHGDTSFSEFLDVFHQRAYLLFYRAWAQSQPHIAYHRPLHNPFARHLGSLVGHGQASSWGREALPTHFRAGLAGHFTRHTRTQEGLACAVAVCTGQPVRVHPFQAQWLQLTQTMERPALGRGAMLGSRVWCAQSKLKLDIGPMPYAAYLKLLPNTKARVQLVQATHAYLGLEFNCDFEFRIHADEVPQAVLGQGRASLGRTAWLGSMQKQRQLNKPATVRVRCPSIPSQSSLFRSF